MRRTIFGTGATRFRCRLAVPLVPLSGLVGCSPKAVSWSLRALRATTSPARAGSVVTPVAGVRSLNSLRKPAWPSRLPVVLPKRAFVEDSAPLVGARSNSDPRS
jgi:hypothetical protein